VFSENTVVMAMEPSNPVAGDDGGGWSDGENEPGDSGLPMAGGDINNPAACLIKGVADGLAGGVMGSVFGFGTLLARFFFLCYPRLSEFLFCF
jgi:hypothetical protein